MTNIINRRTKRIIENALKEDIRKGDITTDTIFENLNITKEAYIKSKSEQIVCGLPIVEEVFRQLDKNVKMKSYYKDGDLIKPGDIIFEIKGDIKTLLKGERTALNFLGHLSGIATATYNMVKTLNNQKIKILDTRKTIPNLRELQKYAVKCGGGENHRMGLYDMVLIKENHIEGIGGVEKALEKIRKNPKLKNVKVEIEIEYFDQLKECLKYPPDIIMLDEMPPEERDKSIKFIRENLPNCKIEISGGITIEKIKELSNLDIDYISIGALTHSVKSGDFTMLIK